jgi:hypothetical protein
MKCRRNRVLLFTLSCVLLLSCRWNKNQELFESELHAYKSVTLDSPTTCNLTLIELIQHLQDLSLHVTRKITGNDELAVSFTLYPVLDWKLEKRVELTFDGLTIYEAFNKIAKEFQLSMNYECGRFIFRDPDYPDMLDSDLFMEVKE